MTVNESSQMTLLGYLTYSTSDLRAMYTLTKYDQMLWTAGLSQLYQGPANGGASVQRILGLVHLRRWEANADRTLREKSKRITNDII